MVAGEVPAWPNAVMVERPIAMQQAVTKRNLISVVMIPAFRAREETRLLRFEGKRVFRAKSYSERSP